MAVAIPPVLLVLDISTLSAASTREWLGFSRVGSCQIPKIIHEEMRFLHNRTPDPDLERVAREFSRFYKTSDWKISDEVAHHPALKSATGEALTKRTRIALAVARCAYGLATENPTNLVVLVASDRSLLQRIYDMKIPNLCAINGATLLQWSQTGQRPIAVIQKIQQMRVAGVTPKPAASSRYRSTASTAIQTGTRIQSTTARVTTRPISDSSSISDRHWFWEALSIVSALLAVGLAGFLAWKLVQYSQQQNEETEEQSVIESWHSACLDLDSEFDHAFSLDSETSGDSRQKNIPTETM